MDPRAFSADGYVMDQDYTADLQYGAWPSKYNGCGWIAVYNLLHAEAADPGPEKVFSAMVEILLHEGNRGTPFQTVSRYFRDRKLKTRRHYGTGALLLRIAADPGTRCGILRYEEATLGRQPHYITFIRTEGNRFRFLNVADGLEDYTSTMEEFVSEHVSSCFWIRVLLPEEALCRETLCREQKGLCADEEAIAEMTEGEPCS